MSNLTQSTSKVMRFREDRRLQIIGALRSLCLAALIFIIMFCIFRYQEDLNTENMKRIISYIEYITFEGETTDTFDFEAGMTTSYKAFDVGVATCAGGSFRFIPPFEDMSFSSQIKYGDPVMRESGNSVFVYDLGGRGISRFNSYSRLAETTLESTILAFSCNDDGMSAVVTDEDGYRTALIVLDKKLNEVYKWQTSEHFAFMPAISPDGDTAAVLCIGQKSAEADLYIRLQETGSDQCRGEIRLGNKRVYSMEFMSNDTLAVLADDGYYVFDMNGEQKGYTEFASGSLITFEHEAEGLCAVSLKGARGSQSRVVVFGRDGSTMFEGTYDGEVRSLALRGGTAAFAAGSHVFRADIETGETLSVELSGIRDVIITGTGSVLAVYPDCARIVAFDVTQGEEA